MKMTPLHRLMESGTVRRCGIVEVGVDLLEEVCHWGWSSRFQMLSQAQCHSLSLLPANLDVEL